MLLKDLLEKIDYINYKINKKFEFKKLEIDSRKVSKDSIFFAIKGINQDGNQYCDDALMRGAVCVITENDISQKVPYNYIQVKDCKKTLAKATKVLYNNPDEKLSIIGVTGTNGKTTVSYLAQKLLGGKESVGLLGTIRYDVGRRTLCSNMTTPNINDTYSYLSEMLNDNCNRAVMEISSHGIDQERVLYINMKTVVFLNLSREHLDYHKSMSNYFNTKKRLFTGELYNKYRLAIVNIDCNYGRKIINSIKNSNKFYTLGVHNSADFKASKLELLSSGSKFLLSYPSGEITIVSKLIGFHNIYNILASFAIAYTEGISVDLIVDRIEKFNGVPGRLENIKVGKNFNVFVDYAHTSDGIDNACKALDSITKNNKIIVFGCGGERDKGKRKLMMISALKSCQKVIVTSDNPRNEKIENIFLDMQEGIQNINEKNKVIFIKSRYEAIKFALKVAEKGDSVLIAGKGHENFQEEKGKMTPFNDIIIVRELLNL